jgi:uncharacterized damage-inducible protein DinB
MTDSSTGGALELLIGLLDEAYDRPAWHGPNLRGALRGLRADAARWRPGSGRHCIWEIALHCAYWKYAVRQHLVGGRRGAFPRKGSNWLPLPRPADAAAWKADLALLDEQHRLLRETVAALPLRRLTERVRKHTLARMIQGVAAHDLYHAGQIRLLIRLSNAKRAR